MNREVVVIGGGVAGIEAAGQLSREGFAVTLIEREDKTGGNIKNWFKLFPNRRDGSEVMKYLDNLVSTSDLKLFKGTSVSKFETVKHRFKLTTSAGNELDADAVVIATGFDIFDSTRKEEYGYDIYDNVITSVDLEEMFRKGRIKKFDGEEPETVGMVHCVGSRDEKAGNLYCSKLCCVTAVKQAIEIREHLRDSRVFCFYMDMRMGGVYYEELYREAQEKWGVNFIRGKVSEVSESIDNNIVVKVEDTLAGRPMKIELDLLVLMAGMEMSEGGKKIAELAKLKTGENRFFEPSDPHFANNLSNMKGIFFAGTCTGPMNITETISHARAAVTEVAAYLKNLKD